MSADIAIKMGVPIYGIIEHVATATDKEGRSVPAPGQGILTTARECKHRFASPLLDVSYRKQHLSKELQAIQQWELTERQYLTASL
jgi:fatty acid synthase subunit alpha, fungi type